MDMQYSSILRGWVAELKQQNKTEKSFLSPGIFATSLLYNKCTFPSGLRAPLSCLGRGAIHSRFMGEGRSHTLSFHSRIAQNQELSTRHYLIKTRHSLRAPYTFRKQGQSALHDQTSQWRREWSFFYHTPQARLKNRTTFSSPPPQFPTPTSQHKSKQRNSMPTAHPGRSTAQGMHLSLIPRSRQRDSEHNKRISSRLPHGGAEGGHPQTRQQVLLVRWESWRGSGILGFVSGPPTAHCRECG